MNNKRLVLLILDGVGERECLVGNAVKSANMKNLEYLKKTFPFELLNASGKSVGLSENKIGNSEVGHLTIGSGKKYKQISNLISDSMISEKFFENNVYKNMVKNVNSNNSVFHLLILLSDGDVHSNIEHLFKILINLKQNNVTAVRIHCLFDGRDVNPKSADKYIKQLTDFLNTNNMKDYLIASGGGRMKYVMDRYFADYSMVESGANLIFNGAGIKSNNILKSVLSQYKSTKINDQYIDGIAIYKRGKYIGKLNDNDSFLMCNYRSDRAIEFSEYIEKYYPKVSFAGITLYDKDKSIPKQYIVKPSFIKNTLNEIMIKNNKKMLAIAETHKFGHITKYFIGNRSEKDNEQLETYIEIPSSLKSFESFPEMMASQVSSTAIDAIKTKNYDFIRINIANGDMVGHTGNFNSGVIALKVTDKCIGEIFTACQKNDYVLIITADHGNAEDMGSKDNPQTNHTTNKVPFIICDNNYKLNKNLGLSNIARTITDILDIPAHKNWDKSIIKEKL